MPNHFDLVVLGAGSTAFAAALRASELGKTVALTESRTLGGTCATRGCLPSKNLIEAASLFHSSSHPRYPGLIPAAMQLDFGTLIGQKDELVEAYREKKYHSIVDSSSRIQVFEGRARFTGTNEVTAGDTKLTGTRFLIATGSSPKLPGIPGLSDTPYLTSDLLTSGEATELKTLPASLLIIGGGYIALELGQMFARFGTQVTLLEHGGRILSAYEPEISQSVSDALRGEGITIHSNASVKRVEGERSRVTVVAEMQGGERELRAAALLVATGRTPNTADLGLELPGIQVDEHGFVGVDEQLRTLVDHIYAAGDVIGGYTDSEMATPVGAQDGRIVTENAFTGTAQKVDHSVIPGAIFTSPQVGIVGLSEQEALARGYACDCRSVAMSMIPRAGAVRDTRGVVKMVADAKTHRVLGVSMHGLNAAEVIHEAAMGLRFGANVEDFARMLHVFPTMAESLKIVALAYTKDISKMSCCADLRVERCTRNLRSCGAS